MFHVTNWRLFEPHPSICVITILYSCRTSRKRRDRWFKTSNFILPRLVDIVHVFCGFQKSLAQSQCLKSITITYRWLLTFFQRTATSTTHFQPHSVVDNSVSDSPHSRTQLLAFGHRGHLGNERPAFTYTCTFYYHTYTHMISRDGRFFTLFRYEIPHVTYRKFNTGISNELASQRECTIGT